MAGVSFRRSVRIPPSVPAGEIVVSEPPNVPQPKRKAQHMVLEGLDPRYGLGAIMGIPSGYFRHWVASRIYDDEYKEAVEAYTETLESHLKELTEKRDQFMAARLVVDPPPQFCEQICLDRTGRLFERSIGDPDFLSVRLGLGTVPFSVEVRGPEIARGSKGETLREFGADLVKRFQSVPEMPVCANLRNSLGILGEVHTLANLVRTLVCQVATFHSPDEVKLAAFLPEQFDLNFLRWLPHCWTPDGRFRLLASQRKEAAELGSKLYNILTNREVAMRGAQAPEFCPIYLVLVGNKKLLGEEAKLANFLESKGAALGVVPIYLGTRQEEIPSRTHSVLRVLEESCRLRAPRTAPEVELVTDSFPKDSAEWWARSLANVQLERVDESSDLPGSLDLFKFLEVPTLKKLDLIKLWQESDPERSLAVPFGVKARGERVYLDLRKPDTNNPKSQGPHGIVAGTTGAGKSAFLQTYFASLAIHFHPHEFGIVAVDFKGGALIEGMEKLPHLIGKVINTGEAEEGPEQIARKIARSFRALGAELDRRSSLHRQLGAKLGISVEENLKYIAQRRLHPELNLEPLPEIVVVCDEFSQMSKDRPELMDQILKVGRVGRSLGVHLLLATQKPGEVKGWDTLRSNLNLFIALRTQTAEDSKSLIECEDAKHVPAWACGRGYLKAGETFDLFQGVYGGVPYSEKSAEEKPSIFELLLDGSRRGKGNSETQTVKRQNQSQIQALTTHVIKTCEKHGIRKLDGPWLEPLGDKLLLEEVWKQPENWLSVAVGRVDDVDRRKQPPLEINLPLRGHLAIYGKPGTGATSGLQALMLSLALAYSPDDINFYLLDMGKALDDFDKLPHTGDRVTPDKPEDLLRLLRYLLRQAEIRKENQSAAGCNNLLAYRQSTNEKVPAILVALDGYAPLILKARENEQYAEAHTLLVKLAQEGASAGIYLAITANSPSQLKAPLPISITQSLCLKLAEADRTDYSLALGRAPGEGPSSPNFPELRGRGIGEGWLEFQFAMPAADKNALKAKIGEIDRAWGDKPRAKKAPVVPGIVELDEISPVRPASWSCVLGLDLDDVVPISFRVHQGPHMAICGPKAAGKTSLLRHVLLTLAHSSSPSQLRVVVVELDGRLALLESLPHTEAIVESAADMQRTLVRLQEELEVRRQVLRKARRDAGGLLDEAEFLDRFPRWLIAIDNYSAVNREFGSGKDNPLRTLGDMLKSYGELGVHLMITGASNEFKAHESDSLLAVVATSQTCVCLATRQPAEFLSQVRISAERGTPQVGEAFFFLAGRFKSQFRSPKPHPDHIRALSDKIRQLYPKESVEASEHAPPVSEQEALPVIYNPKPREEEAQKQGNWLGKNFKKTMKSQKSQIMGFYDQVSQETGSKRQQAVSSSVAAIPKIAEAPAVEEQSKEVEQGVEDREKAKKDKKDNPFDFKIFEEIPIFEVSW